MRTVSGRADKISMVALHTVLLLVVASAAFAASDGGHADSAAVLKDFGWRLLNFVVLAGILVFAIKKGDVKGSLAARQADIEKALKDAEDARDAAEARLSEYSGKLEQASKEIDELHAAIISEGEQEKGRIIAEAKAAAEKIVAQAALSAEQETLKARSELRAEAARLAVEIASGKLAGAIGKNDHDRFVGEYLDKVVQIQ